MRTVKYDASDKLGHRVGGFGIEVLYPGSALAQGDSGIGAIGRIDHAHIQAGTVVKMHPHRDDEILSYMRKGVMIHRDTMGYEDRLTPERMMLMSAGHMFHHEERMAERVEMLQIFLRPDLRDLEPSVQFHDFDAAVSAQGWRAVAGPMGAGAPLRLRGAVWLHDTHLPLGATRPLPAAPTAGAIRLLYVFSGLITIESAEGSLLLGAGESAVFDMARADLRALEGSDLVLLATDPKATVFKGGMFSGNRAAR